MAKTTQKSKGIIAAIAKLTSGNLLAQVLPFLALPFLARQYSPEDFGHFAFFMAVATFVSILILFRLDVAIVSESKSVVRNRLLATGQMVAITFAIFIALVVVIAQTATWLTESYWYWLAISGFALSMHNLSVGWFNGEKRYSLISYFLVLRAFLWVALALSFPHFMPQIEHGLVVAFALSFILVSVLELFIIVRETGFYNLTFIKLKKTLKRFKSFPKYNLPHALMSNINASAPAYILQGFQQTVLLGYFSQTNRLIMTPWHMVSNALYRVLYKDTASELQKETPNFSVLVRVWAFYALGAVCVFVSLYFLVELLIMLVLGKEWSGAVEVAEVMLPWFFFRTITGVLAFAPIVSQQQRRALQIEVCYTVTLVSALISGVVLGSGLDALKWFSLTGAIFVALQLAWYWHLLLSLKKHKT